MAWYYCRFGADIKLVDSKNDYYMASVSFVIEVGEKMDKSRIRGEEFDDL